VARENSSELAQAALAAPAGAAVSPGRKILTEDGAQLSQAAKERIKQRLEKRRASAGKK
jgi:hypothetical protein